MRQYTNGTRDGRSNTAVHPTRPQVAFADGEATFFVGGRQSGKTTGVGFRAAELVAHGDDVIVGAPTRRMVVAARDMFLELVPDGAVGRTNQDEIETAGGTVYFRSFNRGVPDRLPNRRSHIIIDEAQTMPESTFASLIDPDTLFKSVAFTGTSKPSSAFNIYAKYSRFPYQNVGSESNPAVKEGYFQEYKTSVEQNSRPGEDRVAHQLYGEF